MMFGITIDLLVALSFDRYLAVCHPITYHQYKGSRIKKIIFGICVAAGMAVGILSVLGWNNSSTTCSEVDILGFKFMILCCAWTLGSILVITIFYILIYREISKIVSWLKLNFFYVNLQTLLSGKQAPCFVRTDEIWFVVKHTTGRRNQNLQNYIADHWKFFVVLDANNV